jgi:hypothetical protein
MMNRKAVALISGGLDSTLAARIVQEQGIEIEGLHVRLPFECCRLNAAQMAGQLDVKITVVTAPDDYYEIVKNPEYHYGRGANPCVDCRIYLLKLARRFMESVGASFVVTGEVAGQRPNSQKLHQMKAVEEGSGLEGLLLRPLSAKLLKPTIPEKKGIVDRERLYRFSGRSRTPLIALAKQFGITKFPSASGGCPLAERLFARKVFDLIEHDGKPTRWDFDLLKIGRHLRLSDTTKVVIGKDKDQNAMLQHFAETAPREDVTLVRPGEFGAPFGLIVGPADGDTVRRVVSCLAGYSRDYAPEKHVFEYGKKGLDMRPIRGVERTEKEEFRHLLIGLED